MPVFALLAIAIFGTIAIASRQKGGRSPVPEPKTPDRVPPPDDDDPHESDIPWRSDAWTWEIYVEADGTVVAEVGDELRLEDGLVPIEVCPGDTIVLRIDPAAVRRDQVPFMLPPVTWLSVAVNAPEEGDYAWTVKKPKADAWRPTGVGIYERSGGGHARRYGFAVTLSESCG